MNRREFLGTSATGAAGARLLIHDPPCRANGNASLQSYCVADIHEQTKELSTWVPITDRSGVPNADILEVDLDLLPGDLVYLEGQVEVSWRYSSQKTANSSRSASRRRPFLGEEAKSLDLVKHHARHGTLPFTLAQCFAPSTRVGSVSSSTHLRLPTSQILGSTCQSQSDTGTFSRKSIGQ